MRKKQQQSQKKKNAITQEEFYWLKLLSLKFARRIEYILKFCNMYMIIQLIFTEYVAQ